MLLVFLLALLMIFAQIGNAEIIEVPGDHSNITLALEVTTPNDTIWVHPGTYQDRLIFPGHDVVLISDYFMTGDTSAIANTIIDASPFATLDTASVLTFGDSLTITRATFVGGFTLTGGHGTYLFGIDQRHGGAVCMWYASPTIHSCRITENSAHAGPAFFGEGSGARISHCRMFHNCAEYHPDYGAGGNDYITLPLTSSDTLVYEWNEIYENTPCDPGYMMIGGGLSASSWQSLLGVAVVEFNHFHDYECVSAGGVVTNGVRLLMQGNILERIYVLYGGSLVANVNALEPAILTNNVMRDITLEDGECVVINGDGADGVLIERNWFESDSNGGYGPSALIIFHPRGNIRDNMFLDCRAFVGAVQFTQQSPVGCDAVFERNYFGGNRAYTLDYVGSAFSTTGAGPGCTFQNNWFEGNEGVAIGTNPFEDITLDVSGNYWGDPSGPYDSLNNPNGQGDTLGYNTFATWWLTEPPAMDADVHERLRLQPEDWTVAEAFPNPFNASTNLRITSSKPQPFEVTAYNTLGQQVSNVWQGVIPKDSPTLIRWNGSDERGGSVASGVYFLVASPRGPGAGAPKSMKVALVR